MATTGINSDVQMTSVALVMAAAADVDHVSGCVHSDLPGSDIARPAGSQTAKYADQVVLGHRPGAGVGFGEHLIGHRVDILKSAGRHSSLPMPWCSKCAKTDGMVQRARVDCRRGSARRFLQFETLSATTGWGEVSRRRSAGPHAQRDFSTDTCRIVIVGCGCRRVPTPALAGSQPMLRGEDIGGALSDDQTRRHGVSGRDTGHD